MDAAEVGFFSALVEETSKTDESVGRFINEANRNPATIFSHMPGCSAQSGFDCNCTFARMNLNDMCALDADAHFGLEGSATIPVIQFKLSERENKVLSNVSSFFGLVTAGNRAGATSLPKPTSALRMMTNGNDMCFWGPIGIISKFLASTRAAIVELRALIARQAAAILRLLNHLANPGGGASVISRHISGCFAQSGFCCKCTFARMNLNEMSSLGAAEQSGLVGQSCVSRLDAYRARTAHRRRGGPVGNRP